MEITIFIFTFLQNGDYIFNICVELQDGDYTLLESFFRSLSGVSSKWPMMGMKQNCYPIN